MHFKINYRKIPAISICENLISSGVGLLALRPSFEKEKKKFLFNCPEEFIIYKDPYILSKVPLQSPAKEGHANWNLNDGSNPSTVWR